MDICAVLRSYEQFFYACIGTRIAINRGGIVGIRKNYYALEELKREFDHAAYSWLSQCDWRYKNLWVAADGWDVMRLYWIVQKDMREMQGNYFSYLRSNQDEAFPASPNKRRLSPYEEMCYRHHLEEKECSFAASV
jgi:hypothetical protein